MTLTGQGKETRKCLMCKILFVCFKSHHQKTCSVKCSNESKSTYKGRKNMTKARTQLTDKQNKDRHDAEGHRFDYELVSLTGGELMFDEPSVLL